MAGERARQPGISVVKFTIRGTAPSVDVGVHRSSERIRQRSISRRSARCKLATLPRLPAQFRDEALGVRLTFNYEQR